jgi:hypothetical protein
LAQSTWRLCGSTLRSLTCLVASAAASAARGPSAPRSASEASISARRRLNVLITFLGTPCISAMPSRVSVHSTPEPICALAAQNRLVREARRACMRIQLPAVQRRPAPVRTASEVGDKNVGVELRIAGARGPVPERSRDETARGKHLGAAAAAPDTRGRASTFSRRSAHSSPARSAVEREFRPTRERVGAVTAARHGTGSRTAARQADDPRQARPPLARARAILLAAQRCLSNDPRIPSLNRRLRGVGRAG